MENPVTSEKTVRVATWFEIPSADYERAIAFWQRVIGTSLTRETMMGSEMAIFPYPDRAVSGAVVHGESLRPSRDGLVVYLWVDGGLDAALRRVEEAGGCVAVPKTHLSDEIGFVAHIIDSEGNRVGLHSNA